MNRKTDRNITLSRLIIAIIWLSPLIFAGTGYAQNTDNLSPQVIFDQANSQLHEQKYNKALQSYHEIEKRHVGSGPLYLNMALAYTRLDSMGMAKYYYMKASIYPETKQQAQKGLSYANSQLSHESAILPELPWNQLMDNISTGFGIHSFLLLSILILNLGIVIFVFRWFFTKWNKLLLYSSLVLLLCGLLGLSGSFYMQSRTMRYAKAVMVTSKDDVHSKPEKNADIVSNAYEGYVFTVDRERSQDAPDWYYIRMSNGQYGWIQQRDIRIL